MANTAAANHRRLAAVSPTRTHPVASGITSPIVGPRAMEQLEEYLGAPAVTLTDADRAQIDTLVPPGGVISPLYEADFGPHPYRVL